jgi:hypothetical protein
MNMPAMKRAIRKSIKEGLQAVQGFRHRAQPGPVILTGSIVVDASIAIKWVLDEVHSEAAAALLNDWIAVSYVRWIGEIDPR